MHRNGGQQPVWCRLPFIGDPTVAPFFGGLGRCVLLGRGVGGLFGRVLCPVLSGPPCAPLSCGGARVLRPGAPFGRRNRLVCC